MLWHELFFGRAHEPWRACSQFRASLDAREQPDTMDTRLYSVRVCMCSCLRTEQGESHEENLGAMLFCGSARCLYSVLSYFIYICVPTSSDRR